MKKLKNVKSLLALVAIATVLSIYGAVYADNEVMPVIDYDKYSITNAGNRNIDQYHDYYQDEIQSIFTARCVACHSCVAAPCQLNLTSYEGLARGMSKDQPYDYFRFFEEVPKADLDDHYSVEQWRTLGFYPVVKNLGDPDLNAEESILALALNQKEQSRELSEEEIRKLGKHQEDQNYQCPVTKEEYYKFEEEFPSTGMPFGCPRLESEYSKTLVDWIRDGGEGPSPKTLALLDTPSYDSPIRERFEDFLSGNSLRRQAVARYIYEHSFFYDIHFKDSPGEFYRIVRSRTSQPEKIDRITTEFPTDHPGEDVNRVYYRLEKMGRVIEMKKHVLWRIDHKEIDELEESFFDTAWKLEAMPPYTLNPFEWFKVIPVESRAKYVLKYSKHMIHAIGRGSVCHGREASHVVPDYVWALSVKPESDPTVLEPKLGMKDYSTFYTHPREFISESVMKAQLKRKHFRYAKAFAQTLERHKPEGLNLDDIYYGEIFYGLRHETSMEYLSMREHAPPGYTDYKILHGYADFEKSYYRLVAHFKWWGPALHKAEAYIFQTYCRTFGENFWASLSPDLEKRKSLRNFYSSLKAKLFYGFTRDPFRNYPSKLPASWTYKEISQKILERFNDENNITSRDTLNNWPANSLRKTIFPTIDSTEKWEAGLRTLTGKLAPYARYVPNVMHIRLNNEYLYTIFADRGRHNDKIIMLEKLDRNPKLDIIRAKKGFVGPFPHLFVDLEFDEAATFLTRLSQVDSKSSWIDFIDDYKIERNDDAFWKFVDWLNDWISKNMKEDGGLLDLRNYDIRDVPY